MMPELNVTTIILVFFLTFDHIFSLLRVNQENVSHSNDFFLFFQTGSIFILLVVIFFLISSLSSLLGLFRSYKAPLRCQHSQMQKRSVKAE